MTDVPLIDRVAIHTWRNARRLTDALEHGCTVDQLRQQLIDLVGISSLLRGFQPDVDLRALISPVPDALPAEWTTNPNGAAGMAPDTRPDTRPDDGERAVRPKPTTGQAVRPRRPQPARRDQAQTRPLGAVERTQPGTPRGGTASASADRGRRDGQPAQSQPTATRTCAACGVRPGPYGHCRC